MRNFVVLLALIFTVGCSRADSDTSAQVLDWLETLDPDSAVIEVTCTSNVEQPPGSGVWKDFPFTHKFSALEVLHSVGNRALDWSDMVSFMSDITAFDFAGWVAVDKELSMMQTVRFKMNFHFADLKCEGKALKTPTIKIGKCPNDTNGCDQPPMPTELPPPLPPPPGGGGDF